MSDDPMSKLHDTEDALGFLEWSGVKHERQRILEIWHAGLSKNAHRSLGGADLDRLERMVSNLLAKAAQAASDPAEVRKFWTEKLVPEAGDLVRWTETDGEATLTRVDGQKAYAAWGEDGESWVPLGQVRVVRKGGAA